MCASGKNVTFVIVSLGQDCLGLCLILFFIHVFICNCRLSFPSSSSSSAWFAHFDRRFHNLVALVRNDNNVLSNLVQHERELRDYVPIICIVGGGGGRGNMAHCRWMHNYSLRGELGRVSSMHFMFSAAFQFGKSTIYFNTFANWEFHSLAPAQMAH